MMSKYKQNSSTVKKVVTFTILVMGIILLIIFFRRSSDSSETYVKQVTHDPPVYTPRVDSHINYDSKRMVAVYALDGYNDNRSDALKQEEATIQNILLKDQPTYNIAGDIKPVVDGVGNVYDPTDRIQDEWYNNLGNIRCDKNGNCKILTTSMAVPPNHMGFSAMRDRDIRMKNKLEFAKMQKENDTRRMMNGGLLH